MKKRVSSKEAVKYETAKNDKNQEVRFYRSNEKPYGAFSNLFRRRILFEEKEFATAEHAYQAGKPKRPEVQEWLLNAPTPSLVAMAAHGLYTWEIVPNWSEIKFDRMRKVLRAKFSQHEDLREILLSTGNARIVEVGRVDSPVNRTWGEINGKGQNMLGVLLMELREDLKANSSDAKANGSARAKSNGASGAKSNSKKVRSVRHR
jgi:ribA/ribD-fused uncharacterized protein